MNWAGIMKKDFNNLINEIRKCNICEYKFGFKPHQ